MSMRRTAIGLAIVLVARVAAGEPTPAERELAQSLFERGRKALDQGAYSEACPLFAESQRLDPAGGTLINLAFCHEKEGRLATAYSEYGQALAAALAAGRQDRAATARERIAQLESIVPTLSLEVPANSDLPGLEVTLDGTSVPRLAWGTPTRLDPGTHRVGASAPGHQRWLTSVSITGAGDRRTLAVPVLPVEQPPPPPAPVAPVEPAFAPSYLPPPAQPEAAPKRHFSTGTYVVGGIGLAALGFASVAGVIAFEKKSKANQITNQDCLPSRKYCDPTTEAEAEDQADASRKWAWISTGGFIAGGAALLIALSMPRDVERPTARAEARWRLSVRSNQGLELRIGHEWF